MPYSRAIPKFARSTATFLGRRNTHSDEPRATTNIAFDAPPPSGSTRSGSPASSPSPSSQDPSRRSSMRSELIERVAGWFVAESRSASVQSHKGSGHVRRGIGCQEQCRANDLVNRANPSERDLGRHHFLELRTGEGLIERG